MILFVENATIGEDLVIALEEKGFSSRRAITFTNAIHYLKNDVGHILYDTIVLDLGMPIRGLPAKAKEDAKRIFPGWAFYEHVLCDYPVMREKCVFLSGFAEDLRQKLRDNGLEDRYNELYVISKGDPRCVKKLLDFVRNKIRT